MRAAISLSIFVCPAEAHSPRKSLVSVAMAAGMAEIGEFVVPDWIMV